MTAMHLACPVCHETIHFDTSLELWGSISLTDTAIGEVTISSPEVTEHMNAHRRDGTWLTAYERRLATQQINAAAYFDRLERV